MDRRDFIRLVGGGVVLAAGAATASCAPAGSDPRAAWVNPGAGETDIRRKALSFAILAPNPHNMQPWMVDLRTPGEITLYIDRTRLLPVTDPFNRQIVIGCGAFLHLLQLALLDQGYPTEVDYFPDGEDRVLDDRPIFRVFIGAHSDRSFREPLFGQALNRRTHRGPFTDKQVGSEDVAALLAAAGGLPIWIRSDATVDAERVKRLRAIVFDGAGTEARTPSAHRESVERTFIGARDVAKHPWGISLDRPEMTAMNAVGLLTKMKMATPGTIAYNESLKFLKTAADTSRGFVWVTSKVPALSPRQDELLAGAAYLRLNLAAAARGLAMHPWSQGLQEYATQKPVFDALHKELAPDGGRIQMLARIGYPKSMIRPAPRRGLAAQILKA